MLGSRATIHSACWLPPVDPQTSRHSGAVCFGGLPCRRVWRSAGEVTSKPVHIVVGHVMGVVRLVVRLQTIVVAAAPVVRERSVAAAVVRPRQASTARVEASGADVDASDPPAAWRDTRATRMPAAAHRITRNVRCLRRRQTTRVSGSMRRGVGVSSRICSKPHRQRSTIRRPVGRKGHPTDSARTGVMLVKRSRRSSSSRRSSASVWRSASMRRQALITVE